MTSLVGYLGIFALLATLDVQCRLLHLSNGPQMHDLQSTIFSVLESGITKVIHQSWKSHKLLPHHAVWRESWKEKHPQWLYKLWTDNDNHRLIEKSLPWLLDTYKGMPAEIYRADIARYAYMYVYGGVYVDLDFECITPLDELLANQSVALAYDIRADNGGADIANAFMASVPGHPFWIHLLTSIVEAFGNPDIVFNPVFNTGPGAISEAYRDFARVKILPVFVAPAGMIYPLPDADLNQDPCRYRGAAFDAAACKLKHSNAIAVTYWTGSWM